MSWVTDPRGRDVPLKVSREGDKFRYEFAPRHTGKYMVYVDVDNTSLPGSPFVYYVQPSSGVIVTDVTEEGDVGEEMYFIGKRIILFFELRTSVDVNMLFKGLA